MTSERITLSNEQELEPTRRIDTIHFINGLTNDSVNEWAWRVQRIMFIREGKDIEENLEDLRDPVKEYDQRLLSLLDKVPDPVYWAHHNPESSEEAIAEFDRLAEEYNQLIEAPKIDLDALVEVIKAACALYGRETPDIKNIKKIH